MNRIVVAGAGGFFGSAIVRVLRTEGFPPLISSRRKGGDLVFNVEDRESIRKAIRPKDVIVDATAPFQTRTTALVNEAIEAGADVVDISDSLAYARLVWMRNDAARNRGVRVLNACSSVSVLSSFAIEHSGVHDPIAIHGFLAPETRHTANPGVAQSLLASVGQSISVWRGGEMRQMHGWTEARRFTALRRYGHLTEMADAFTLPRLYPSLENVDFWVNPNTFGAATLLGIVARVPALSPTAALFARYGMPFVRILGRDAGVLAYEVESRSGNRSTVMFTGHESFLMAAIPAALAAIRLAAGQPCPAGVVPVDQHVDMSVLVAALKRYGIRIERRNNL